MITQDNTKANYQKVLLRLSSGWGLVVVPNDLTTKEAERLKAGIDLFVREEANEGDSGHKHHWRFATYRYPPHLCFVCSTCRRTLTLEQAEDILCGQEWRAELKFKREIEEADDD